MTRDRGFKRLVRARMGRTGEAYSTARAHLSRHATLATLTRRELVALPDAELVARCLTPTLGRLRDDDRDGRARALRELSGQGPLFALWILHAHTEAGLTGLCAALSHRLLDDHFWTLMDAGLLQLDERSLRALVHRLEEEVARALAAAGHPVRRTGELDHDQYLRLLEALEHLDAETMRELDDEFRQIMPGAMRRAAARIRARPGDFVSVVA